MKIEIQPRSKWPLSSAAVISDMTHLHLIMKELVRTAGWRIDDAPALPELALEYLQNGSSFLYIIDDTTTLAAYESINTIISTPAGRLTPIVVLLSESSAPDTSVYEKILHVAVAKKPFTPSLFLPAFRGCVSQWETPLFMAMRRCAYSILSGDTDIVIPVLKKLIEVPQAAPYCTQALVSILSERNQWQEAEAILMSAVKAYPRTPSLMHTVAKFYLSGHMPAHALRFLNKLRIVCKNTPLFAFDIAQVALSLGQIDVAIEALLEWNKIRPGNEKVVQFISRLYMADGREAELEKLLNMNKINVKRLQETWDKAENQPASVNQSA